MSSLVLLAGFRGTDLGVCLSSIPPGFRYQLYYGERNEIRCFFSKYHCYIHGSFLLYGIYRRAALKLRIHLEKNGTICIFLIKYIKYSRKTIP